MGCLSESVYGPGGGALAVGVRGKYSQSARVAEEGSGGSAGIPCTMCGTPRSGRLAALQHAELCFIVVRKYSAEMTELHASCQSHSFTHPGKSLKIQVLTSHVGCCAVQRP